MRLAAAAVVLLALAPPAWANAGIGYFMLALPFLIVALLPAIVLEAGVLAPMLAVPFRRALDLSARANLRSTLWGIALGIAADIVLVGFGGSSGPPPTRVAASVMLVPFFFLSWSIEKRAVLRRAAELPPKRVVLSTGAANLASYAAMVALAWAILPAQDPMLGRSQVSEAISLTAGAKTPLREYFQDFRKWPDSIDQVAGNTKGKYTQSVVISKGAGGTGEIELTATMKTEGVHPAIAGKTIRFWSQDQGHTWACGTGNAPEKFLPGACR